MKFNLIASFLLMALSISSFALEVKFEKGECSGDLFRRIRVKCNGLDLTFPIETCTLIPKIKANIEPTTSKFRNDIKAPGICGEKAKEPFTYPL
jgi:hypothetical protein